MNIIIRCIFFLLLAANAWALAPNGTISGQVYDDTNGEALIGANVYLQGTNIGAVTNTNGFYSIPKIPIDDYVLVCQFIGYAVETRDVKVRNTSNLNIDFRLSPEALETEQVVVTADSMRTSEKLFRKEISNIQLAPRQIEMIPQVAEADLLRSLQTLPGIVPVSDFSSELYVRGGTPDQNLYMMDGADVYNPEHFFGLFSTFNTDAIKNVEISKGGFGAEYGGRLSSVLNVTNLDGNRNEFEGNVSVSMLSAKTTLQSPLGNFGSISGSFRRTYFDKTYRNYSDDIPDYHFYDGHLKTFIEIDKRNKLTLSGYWGKDDLDFSLDPDAPNTAKMRYDWGNQTASARWTHIFSSKLFSNFWVTQSRFDSDFNFEIFSERNQIKDLTVKGDLEYYASQKFSNKFGFEIKQLSGFLKQDFPGGRVNAGDEATHYAGYFQTAWQPTPLWNIEAGLRYNYFAGSENYQNWSPRLSAKYRLSETASAKVAFGRYHQYLYKIPRTFIVDVWTTADQYYEGSSANHYVLGYQKELFGDISFEAEAYMKDYTNIYVYDYFFYVDVQPTDYTDSGAPIYGDTQGLFLGGTAQSLGVEFLLRKDTGPVSGWIAYTLGSTEYTIDKLNNGNPFAPRHDRRSTLNVVSNIDIRNAWRQVFGQKQRDDRTKWTLGASLVYASGQPITTTNSVYWSAPVPDQVYLDGINLLPTERNAFRLPAYSRLDLSLTYRRRFKNWTLEPYIQVYNAGNRENVWFFNYERTLEDNKIVQDVETVNMLPILPTIGVNMHF